jgi:hypothetical protein
MAPLPKYEAIAHGYRPCSHCGHFTVRVRDLPPPFGHGRLSDREEPEAASAKELESHTAEIRDLITKRVWDKARVDLKVPWKENLTAMGRIDYHAKKASEEMLASGKAHVEIPNLIAKAGQKPLSIDLTVRRR